MRRRKNQLSHFAPLLLLFLLFLGLTATRLLVSQDQDIRQNASGGFRVSNQLADGNCIKLQLFPPLESQALSDDSVLLTWDNLPGGSNYSILYGTQPEAFTHGVSKLGATSEYLITDLNPNTTYHFAIFANNACSTSYRSHSTATTLMPGMVVPAKLKVGVNKDLSATASATTPSTPPDSEVTSNSLPDLLTNESNTNPSWLLQTNTKYLPYVAVALLISLVSVALYYLFKKRPRRTPTMEHPDIPFQITGGQPLPNKPGIQQTVPGQSVHPLTLNQQTAHTPSTIPDQQSL